MKSSIYLSLCLSLFISCTSDDKESLKLTCSVEDPVNDLDWLKTETELLDSYESIIQSTFNNEAVFIFNNCNPRINSVIPVKNCNGDNIGIISNEQDGIPVSVLENGTMIWRPDNFECNL